MTGKARIQSVLRGEKPDRVPWVPLIGRYYVRSMPEMGYPIHRFAPREKAVNDALRRDLNLAEIEAIRLTGGDILYRHVLAYNLKSKTYTYYEKQEGEQFIRGWDTPSGEIHEVIEVHHGTEYHRKHMIETVEDLKTYTSLLSSMEAEASYQDLIDFSSYIGEDGLATMSGPLTPIQDLLQFQMGVEKTTFAFFDHEKEIQEYMAAQHRLNLEVYDILSKAPGEMVITYEDTSTTVLSPDWYRDHEAPHLNEYADILKAGDKTHIAHMCGKISLLLDQLHEDRYDGIDSVCPPETGDTEPGAALEGSGKLIIGGLEPAALVRMSADETYDYAMEKLEQVRSLDAFDRFMLGSGDSVAALTPMDNLQAVTKAVEDFNLD